MRVIAILTALLAGTITGPALAAPAPPPPPAPGSGHITGLGGVFVVSQDPKALARWYRDVLEINLEAWGGALLRYDAPGHPPLAVWNAMAAGDGELAPSQREFMVNFAVDDLDAYVARLQAKGVKIVSRQQDENGKFASIVDPDGTKIEFWQPLKR